MPDLLFPGGGCKERRGAQAAAAVDVPRQQHVRQHRHARKKLDVLKGPPDADPHQLVGRQMGDVPAVETDAALLRPVETGHAVQQAGLARAVRTDHRDQLTGAHGQIDVVQRPDAAEMQGQLRNVQFGPGIFPTPRAEDARPAAL